MKNSTIRAGLMLATATYFLAACQNDSLNDTLPTIANDIQVEQAYPNQQGIMKNATIFGENMAYHEINGQHILEGDIILDPSQMDEGRMTEGTYRTLASSHWTSKTVYYTIDAGLANQVRVTDAIAHWQANTLIKFVKHTNQSNYVTFRTGTGCSSSVGKVGGQQFVNLASGCSTGNTIHEIGHTVGLWHEQTRKDRDTYVTVNFANITAGYEGNFKTYTALGQDGELWRVRESGRRHGASAADLQARMVAARRSRR